MKITKPKKKYKLKIKSFLPGLVMEPDLQDVVIEAKSKTEIKTKYAKYPYIKILNVKLLEER